MLSLLATIPAATAAGAEDTSGCPCSLFAADATPTVVDWNDGNAVELGMKFETSVAGWITGVRFHKSAANTGSHVGSLWTSTGELLARAVFTDETESGWQHVSFDVPVAVTPGVDYVVSYHTPTGHYSADSYYWLGNGVTNGPLYAPGEWTDTNGLFAYSPVPTFPTGSYNGTNYWVDVVFVTEAPLTGISVAPVSVPAGLTAQLQVNGHYADGSTRDLTALATFSSADPAVATVSDTGLVTGLVEGSTTLTATAAGRTVSVPVTVTPPIVMTVAITPGAPSVDATLTQQLTATATLSNGALRDVTATAAWSSSDPAIATVSSSGLLTALEAGAAQITAVADGVAATVTVTVTPGIKAMAIVGAPASLADGLTAQLSAVATRANGTTRDVSAAATWQSSDPAIATVSPTGLLTATGVGQATITVTYGGVSTSVVVKVTPAVITHVEVTPSSPTMRRLSGLQFRAYAVYTDGTRRDVTWLAWWSSSNPLLATVTNFMPWSFGGYVSTSFFTGTVRITACYAGFTGTATVKIA